MKVIAITRALNEERNIERLWKANQGVADLILIADGGSTDQTINIACCLPGVKVLRYPKTVEVKPGTLRNPEGEQTNFLIKWAISEGADWIIFYDADEFNNYLLQKNLRGILEETDVPAIWTRMIHFWGEDKIIPALHEIEMTERRVTAWRPDKVNLWAREHNPIVLELQRMGDVWDALPAEFERYKSLNDIATMEDQRIWLEARKKERALYEKLKDEALKLDFPYCVLHYGYQNEEVVEYKTKLYGHKCHPLDGFELADPEPFMREEELG